MTQQKTDEKWVGIGDLVADLLGYPDKPTADIITRHAKERTKKGHASIPKQYLRREMNPDNRKQRFAYLLSAESRVFFKNLLDLESVLPSRVVARVLRREHLSDPKTLRRALAASKKEMEAKWQAYGTWLTYFPELERRLLDPDVDLRSEPLLPEHREVGGEAPDALAPTTTPASLSFHVVRQLEELEKRASREHDDHGVEAQKALHVLRLGEHGLAEAMVQEVLESEPDHGLANYAFAMVYLARAEAAERDAARYQIQYQEAELRHEAYWEGLMADAAMDARERRRKALGHLVLAFRNWPFTDWNGRKHWTDYRRRGHLLAALVQIAFEFSHAHASVDYGDYIKIGARQRGEDIDHFFGPDMDSWIVEAAKEVEESTPMPLLRYGPLRNKSMLLQLYFVLSPKDYERLLPKWLDEFTKSPPRFVEPLLEGAERRSLWPNLIREHLQRNLDLEERSALLAQVENESRKHSKTFYEGVRAFMARTPEEEAEAEDEYYESF